MSAPLPVPAKDDPPIRPAILWGVVFGAIQVASPLGFWWLDAAVVYALGLAVIAAIYVGFAVADGRWKVIAVETVVAMGFIVLASAGITASAWLLVAGFLGHGVKDAWQHRTRFVSGTRWWPPFCAAIDWVVAAAIAAEIVVGMQLRP